MLQMLLTVVAGVAGYLMARTFVRNRLRFVDVNLEADPLDIEAVEQLLPDDLPIEGLEIGGAVVRGEQG